MNRDHAREVRLVASDPVRLCRGLGLLDGSTRQARGLLIRCPSHGERNASCSVTKGPDGTVRVRCFACDFSGDALHLTAVVYGLSLEDEFREVLAQTCEAVGNHSLASEILDGEERPNRSPIPEPEPEPPADYPNPEEVVSLWKACDRVADDTECSSVLVKRRIDPLPVSVMSLAKAIPRRHSLPRWGAYKSLSWVETGHRLIVPMWSSDGRLVSVRAWRVIDGESPKRLPPAGRRASGLVMANQIAVDMLRGQAKPKRLVVVEGEPDHLVASLQWPAAAVIGVVSGSWCEAFARRVPSTTEIVIATHFDAAGESYAARVAKTLEVGHAVWRATA